MNGWSNYETYRAWLRMNSCADLFYATLHRASTASHLRALCFGSVENANIVDWDQIFDTYQSDSTHYADSHMSLNERRLAEKARA